MSWKFCEGCGIRLVPPLPDLVPPVTVIDGCCSYCQTPLDNAATFKHTENGSVYRKADGTEIFLPRMENL